MNVALGRSVAVAALVVGALSCKAHIGDSTARVQAEPALVVLSDHGHGWHVIHVPEDVMAADETKALPFLQAEAEQNRRRLRESVKDLAEMLHRITGADFPVSTDPPKADEALPILVDRYAQERFGKPTEHTVLGQGFRVVVTPKALGLIGDSALGTSYAIYELLHRLGCRWYMPGDLGEVIPTRHTLTLAPMDISRAPYTYYRGVWYADDAYRRRNRTGGLQLAAGHGLEGYISAKQRQEHPDWRGIVGGKPHERRLNWSKSEVANAISETLVAALDKRPEHSVTLSPDDGVDFSDTPEERAMDGGDVDRAMGMVSLTDRLMLLTNRIAQGVTAKYPDELFGVLAYVQFTKPPVREKVHPNVVPQIAPIVYCRAQPFTDERCPGSKELRELIVGWGKAARMVSYYSYAYNLSETSAPNPMVTKWAKEIPFLLSNNVRFWQPETMPNFETTAGALYIGLRLSFDPSEQPFALVNEMYLLLYGAAASPMRHYFETIDNAWVNTPEYCGGERSYLVRFPPLVLKEARTAIDEALSLAKTPLERRRVEMQNASLKQFELYMKMRRAWASADFKDLAADAREWRAHAQELATAYKDSFAFELTGWAPESVGATYFRSFVEPSYLDAARIAESYQVLSQPSLSLSWQPDRQGRGLSEGWQSVGYDDHIWPTTNPAIDSWSKLGLHSYMGKMWYRTRMTLPVPTNGKRTYVWLGAIDGSVRVWANGVAGKSTWQEKGDIEVDSFARPVSFDITDGVAGAHEVTLAILAERKALNELGSGGITGPLVVYCEK